VTESFSNENRRPKKLHQTAVGVRRGERNAGARREKAEGKSVIYSGSALRQIDHLEMFTAVESLNKRWKNSKKVFISGVSGAFTKSRNVDVAFPGLMSSYVKGVSEGKSKIFQTTNLPRRRPSDPGGTLPRSRALEGGSLPIKRKSTGQ